MPVTTTKTKSGYTNSTPHGIRGKGMSKSNAMKQKALLNAIDKGFDPKKGESLSAFWKRYKG